MRMRLLIGLCGLALGLWGVVALFDRPESLLRVGLWLAGSVAVHDFVLVPITLGVGAALTRFTSPVVRRILVRALLIIAPVTLASIPVLGRFGAKPDNPTLLDGDYLRGWTIVAVIALTASVLLAVYETRSRAKPPERSDDDG